MNTWMKPLKIKLVSNPNVTAVAVRELLHAPEMMLLSQTAPKSYAANIKMVSKIPLQADMMNDARTLLQSLGRSKFVLLPWNNKATLMVTAKEMAWRRVNGLVVVIAPQEEGV